MREDIEKNSIFKIDSSSLSVIRMSLPSILFLMLKLRDTSWYLRNVGYYYLYLLAYNIIESLNIRLEVTSRTQCSVSRQMHSLDKRPGSPFRWFLKVSTAGKSTTSLGRLFQWLIVPIVKNFPIVFNQNQHGSILYSLPLYPLLVIPWDSL